MQKVYVLSGMVLGIVLVLACGEMVSGTIDAGTDARAQNCLGCEKPITTERVYYVRTRESRGAGGDTVGAVAPCNSGDLLLAGGCWVYHSDDDSPRGVYRARHSLVASGPVPQAPKDTAGMFPDNNTAYECLYEDAELDRDLIVVATAICLKPSVP